MHDISLQPTTPDIDLTYDDKGTDPTHDKDLNVHQNNTGTYSISIEN